MGPTPTVRALAIKGGKNGIQVSQRSSAAIIDVTITDAGEDGILCVGRAIITGVTIQKSKGSGISVGNRATIIRSSIITQNDGNGVVASFVTVDLGTADEPGNNEIFRNGGFHVVSVGLNVSAIGNWWGSDPPNEALFSGNVNYEPWLTEPPISTHPTISNVEPNAGNISGGTLIKLTGSRFVKGATVTIGGNPATGVTVDSDTQLTAITPAGTAGPVTVMVTNLDGKSGSKEIRSKLN
jgi:hypothetical protein